MQINIKIFKERYYNFRSTVYPGCTEEFCKPILEKYSKLKFKKTFILDIVQKELILVNQKLMILLKSPVDQILNLLK